MVALTGRLPGSSPGQGTSPTPVGLSLSGGGAHLSHNNNKKGSGIMATLYHWKDEVLDEQALGERTQQAFVEIESMVDDIVALAWDGCHKIYLALDRVEAEHFRRLGYGDDSPSEFLWAGTLSTTEILDVVQQWYYESCGLVFINSVKECNYEDIIPQVFTSEDGE